MILCDINVFVYAHRREIPDHDRYRAWLAGVMASPAAYGVNEQVLAAVVRIITNRRIFRQDPTPLGVALQYVDTIRSQPHAVVIQPGENHWSIFKDLCQKTNATGGLITDAYLAALAIESGSEWITVDRDFARFPDLRWRHPFDHS